MSPHNPHPDFKTVESSRPPFDASQPVTFTKTPNPDWKFGDGTNQLDANKDAPSPKKHISIDPYAEGRPSLFNYKLLISATVPRPVAFISSRSPDGKTLNLAPFSYFNMINHDPRSSSPKDTLKNIVESKECVINIISEHFVEAANATSIDAPYGSSEWDVSGLTPEYSTETVGAPRIKEAILSIEAKLESVREFESKSVPGKKSGTLVVLEGTRFWVREDAINEDRSIIDLNVLKPISRLGGITYGRTNEVLELPRPQFEKDLGGQQGLEKLQNQKI
ncbi:hypothetical protein PT974_08147 [Cladobotryum mycophilum]|uniref:Flavin reductase like domain-containing protein n=1 Tax=Cladobotryum mycophilum TaxID=491253 RepID=A0ABR0SDP5_9HYPO